MATAAEAVGGTTKVNTVLVDVGGGLSRADQFSRTRVEL